MATKKVDTSNRMGITSLVLGIISIVFCWVPVLGLLTGVIGIVLSVKQKKSFPNGVATGGLVTSIIGVVFSTIYLLIYWILIISIGSIRYF